MPINFIIRDKSLLTDKSNLEPLYSLKNFPVFIGCTDENENQDLTADMNFDICKDTGFIQLKNPLPLELVYNSYHSEAVGKTWENHRKQFSKFILKFSPKNILEIGGSNAALAQLVTSKKSDINWTIVDPNPAFNGNECITVIKDYFSDKFSFNGLADTIIHSHALEHLYDPVIMLKFIYNFMETGSKHIFSIPNLHKWLLNKFPNALNFEHTVFLTEYFIDYLLPANGFKVIEKKYFGEHSIFYATEKNSVKIKTNPENKYTEYKKIFLDLIDYYQELTNNLNEKIKSFDGKIYLFGAHIFSQYLIYFGLNKGKIAGILDNSQIKQGKRLYGSSLFVENPQSIKKEKEVAVILKVGSYREEILKQLAEINPNIIIFE